MTPRLTLFVAAGAAVLAGTTIAWLLHGTPDESPADDNGVAAAPSPATTPAVMAPTTAPASEPAPPGAALPAWLKPANDPRPALTLGELQELQQMLATSSAGPDDEFARLTEQMLLADATRRFLQLRSSPQPDHEELHGLVELIGPVLDAQLRRGELTQADALDLKARLLEVQYPQAAMQQGELARWRAAQPGR